MAPKPRKKDDREILDAARDCFLAHGPGVSTEVIAEHAGLSQACLFKRFKTKEKLMLDALLPSAQDDLTAWLNAGPAAQNLRPQLQELIERLWSATQEAVPRMSVLHMSGILRDKWTLAYEKIPYLTVSRSIENWLRRAQNMGIAREDFIPCHWTQTLLGTLLGRALLNDVLLPHFGAEDTTICLSNDDENMILDSVVHLFYQSIAVPGPIPDNTD